VTQADRLRAAFDSRDLDTLIGLLDNDVLWRGLRQPDGEVPLCRNRGEVREVLANFLARGGTGDPLIIGEVGDSIVVDPRPDPPRPFELHQVFTFRGSRIALMQDYPDRASALEAVGLA